MYIVICTILNIFIYLYKYIYIFLLPIASCMRVYYVHGYNMQLFNQIVHVRMHRIEKLKNIYNQ